MTTTAQFAVRHMLSFDVEEYFHAEAVAVGGLPRERWGEMPCRLAESMDEILTLLAERKTTATFFILGWVARHEESVVRRIAAAGHEIASHGMSHAMLTRLEPAELAAELSDSKALLEDLGGRPVLGFRAPTFSVMHRTAWALDVLVQCGYEYDSSIFPIRHDRYGVPEAPAKPHWGIGPGGGRILELPLLTLRVPGNNLPVGGGGYLRLFPTWLVAQGLRRAEKHGHGGMVYLHPWEFDPGHPVMAMGRVSRWRHRVNLHKTHRKLRRLMEQFPFTDIRSQLPHLRETTTMFQYGQAAS